MGRQAVTRWCIFFKCLTLWFIDRNISTVILTGNGKGESELGRRLTEGNFEPLRRRERVEEVAHHVDLDPVHVLIFRPLERVVEEIETVRIEVAVQLDEVARVEDEDLTGRQHV